jgi:hypothetical protein
MTRTELHSAPLERDVEVILRSGVSDGVDRNDLGNYHAAERGNPRSTSDIESTRAQYQAANDRFRKRFQAIVVQQLRTCRLPSVEPGQSQLQAAQRVGLRTGA